MEKTTTAAGGMQTRPPLRLVMGGKAGNRAVSLPEWERRRAISHADWSLAWARGELAGRSAPWLGAGASP